MERLEFGYSAPSNDKSTRATKPKCKWREIESLREIHELKKELQELDWALDFDTDNINLY